MPNIMQSLRNLLGGGNRNTRQEMEKHIMAPAVIGGSNGAFSQDEANFLGINPFEQTMDVHPVTSTAAAHGYLYLQSRALFDLLDEMADRDTTVGGGLELIVAYMLMRPSGLTMAEEDTEKPGAGDILKLVQNELIDSSNWGYMLWSLAEGLLRHGRATVELRWAVSKDGYYNPVQFYHCHPGQFTFDRDGKMYMAMVGEQQEHVRLPPLKFATVARPALYDNPWGSSIIYPCRFLYHFKKRAMIYRLRYAENHGEPIYHAWVDAMQAANAEESRDKLSQALQRIGQHNFIVTAAGEHLEVHTRGAGGGDNLHSSIANDYDTYMTKRLLGATLNTGTAENGTRALGEVHERTMINRVSPPARLLCDCINEQIIDPWCDVNLPPGSPRPYWFIDTEEETDAEAARATLQTAVDVGLEVAAEEARERLGFRQPMEGEEVIGGKKPEPPPAKIVQVPGTDIDPPAEDDDEQEETASDNKPHLKFAANKFGWVELSLPEDQSASVEAWARENIDKEDLVKGKKAGDPHITLLYGLTKDDPEPVKRALLAEYPALAFYGRLEVFETEEADVLHVSIDGWGLEELRKALLDSVDYDANMDIAAKEGYHPHVTLAYLKPGTGSKYTTQQDEDGEEYGVYLNISMALLDTARFHTSKGDIHEYRLTGPYAEFSGDSRNVAVRLQERLQGAEPPSVDPPPYPTSYGAALARYLPLAKDGPEPLEIVELMLSESKPDRPEYAEVWQVAHDFIDLQQAFKAAALASGDVQLSVKPHPGWTFSTEEWRGNATLRHNDFNRVFQQASAMEKRLEAIAADIHESARAAVLEMVRRTVKSIDELAVDVNSPIPARALNVIDPEPIMEEMEKGAQLLTVSTWMLSFGYTEEIAKTAKAARAEMNRPPEFWDSGVGYETFDEGADWRKILKGWGLMFAQAADWMLARGIITTRQLRRMAEMMAEKSPEERAAIEAQLRRDFLALAGIMDLNLVKAMQKMIADSIKKGKSLAKFLEEMDKLLGDSVLPGSLDSYLENVLRTETSNAYNEQQKKQEANPDFSDIHWGHLAGNPDDERSDPTHARTRGVYYKKGSQAWNALGTPPYRYRCRCYLTPLVDPDPENSEFKESDNALSVALNVTRF